MLLISIMRPQLQHYAYSPLIAGPETSLSGHSGAEIVRHCRSTCTGTSCLFQEDVEKILSGDDEASLEVGLAAGLKSWRIVCVVAGCGLERFACAK